MNNKNTIFIIAIVIILLAIGAVMFFQKNWVANPLVQNPPPVNTPTTTEGIVITLENNNTTTTLTVGQTFLLKLGENYNWSLNVSNQNVFTRVKNIAVIRGAQGIYVAVTPGEATLTAVGDPLCRASTPPCAAPSIQFKLGVVVLLR